MSLLSVIGLKKSFGAVKALDDVSFDMEEGEVLGIIGPNGAGKTTLFNVIVGLCAPDAGEVLFRGRSMINLPPHRICRAGVTKTSQIVHPFAALTVKENVLVALMYGQKLAGKEALRRVGEIMELLDLADVSDMRPNQISLPKRRRLELARAVGAGAELILMDENMAGLNPGEMQEAIDIVRELKRRGKTLVIVEHVMQTILSVCERLMVLSYGEKIVDGPPLDVCSDERVIRAYLGEPICSA